LVSSSGNFDRALRWDINLVSRQEDGC